MFTTTSTTTSYPVVKPKINPVSKFEKQIEEQMLKNIFNYSKPMVLDTMPTSITFVNKEILITVDKVIYNPPATCVFWSDGTKTIVKATDNEIFVPVHGVLYAFYEKMSGKTKTQANKFLDSLDDMFTEQMSKQMAKKSKQQKEKTK